MIRFVILIALVFFMAACSSQAQPDAWRYKSAHSFDAYKNNFYQGKELLAKSELHQAQEYASMGADLSLLAHIYLGECALHISVGQEDKCPKYLQLMPLIQEESLQAYYALLQKDLEEFNKEQLPKIYHDYVDAIKSKRYNKAFENILSMDKISSELIASALIKEHLSIDQQEIMLHKASHYGYKKAALFWLEQIKGSHSDLTTKEKIEKRIQIITKGLQ